MADTIFGPTPSGGFQIPTFVLDDLCSRFIINLPEEERQNLIRVFFQIELAHWFYLDFYCQDNPTELRACGIKDFSAQVFRHCPTLIKHADDVQSILGSWRVYKMAVPTYGAILLNPELTHCVLVQGYWARANWGFPKGKVNEDEAPHTCAIREVLEETGFDISSYLVKDEFIEYKMNEQISRLYIVPGVSMDTVFQPRTRNEIKKVEWFCVENLPVSKKDTACKKHYGLAPNAFFMVIPFVRTLQRWIAKPPGHVESDSEPSQRQRRASQQQQQQGSDGGEERGRHLRPVQLFGTVSYGGKGRTASTSPGGGAGGQAPRSGKKKQQKASPKKQYHLLKRDGTIAGGTGNQQSQPDTPDNVQQVKPEDGGGSRSAKKRASASHGVKPSNVNPFQIPAVWTNFKIDVDSVLKCL